MKTCGPQLAPGIQRLLDSAQAYRRGSLPFYLRLKNFPDLQDQRWSQLGFVIAPTGTTDVGYTDTLILPAPTVIMMPVKNIAASNGKLRFGARKITVSHSFVQEQMQVQGLTSPEDVWKGPLVMGLVTERKLCDIVDIEHIEIGGATVQWFLSINVNEVR